MNHPFAHATLAAALLTSFLAAPASADIVIPPEATPPTAAQVQEPPAKQPVPAAATPVALAAVAETAIAQQDQIVGLLRAVLADAPAVVLVDSAATPTALPEGHAKNVATEPVAARYTVRLAIAPAQSAALSTDYLPVTLTVADAKDKTLGTEQLRYRETDEAAFSKAARTFLGKHLPLSTTPADPKPTASGPQPPRLQAWIESSDGDAMKIGSRIAFYFQASTKGYVSLYHFASSGAVQRIYPTEQEPDNFVEPGQIYRYPQRGELELKGPAGEETVKAILTVLPSNTPRVLPGGLTYKGDPLQIIPTHYPVLFATRDLSRFFALPPHLYTETHIRYTLKSR